MKKFALAFMIFPLVADLAGQDLNLFRRNFSVSWDVNLPLTNTTYIKNATADGIMIGYRERMSDHFYMGVDLSSAHYSDYSPRQTYYSEMGAFTSDFFKYTSSYGAVLSGNYFFRPDRRLMPFVGLGAGVSYHTFRLYYNIYSQTDSNWGFLMRPEAGAMLKFGKRGIWGLITSVHFDYSSVKNETFGYKNFTSAGFRTGLVFWLEDVSF
jgi:hypothetical protein